MHFRLRESTNKYHLFHEDYLEQDRSDVREMAVEFAKVFGISYERIKVKSRFCSYSTDVSDFYGNGTSTTAIETWLIVKWASVYHTVDYYKSPHLDTAST